MQPHIHRHRITCLAALVAALACSPAWADFGAPVTLSDAGAYPQVAFDADGDALVVWEGYDGTNHRVQARARSAAGVLGPIETLSAAGRNSYRPKVAVDADGDALVIWRRGGEKGTISRIQARARSAAGMLGPIQNLSEAGRRADSHEVAIDAEGDALVVWSLRDGPDPTPYRIQARARSAAGVLGPVATLSRADRFAYDPQVAIDADGDALVVWRVAIEGTNSPIQARARSRPGRWGPVVTLSAGTREGAPQVAVDFDGDALVVWHGDEGIRARARSAAGALGPIETLSKPGGRVPEVAIDADGAALAVWRRSDGSTDLIYARARSAAGVLDETQTLSAAGWNADVPEVAVSAEGDGVAVWERRGTTFRVQARARSAAGVLGPIETLSRAGSSAYAP